MAILGTRSRSTALADPLHNRLRYLVIVVFLGFGALTLRLWRLQVSSGERYFRETRQNVVDRRAIPSVRGSILDRNGIEIARNRPAFGLYGKPKDIGDDEVAALRELLQLNTEETEGLTHHLENLFAKNPRSEALLLSDLTRERAALVRQEQLRFPFVNVQDTPSRDYPHGSTLAHVVGYMNRINGKELRSEEMGGYSASDLVGRYGLENQWESFLRGKRGMEQFLKNAKGQRVDSSDSEGLIEGPLFVPPVRGHNLILTIDLPFQKAVEAALKKHPAGAAAVVEVNTGKVLALASTPSFDPNIMTGRLTRALAAQMNKDPRKPFIDKTLRQYYPPGSTYKFITALAALEGRLISPSEPLTCNGSHMQGKRRFRCTGSHGKVDLREAIQHSCNVYFWKISERVGLDAMAEVALDFGFGAPTGFGLNGDSAGRVPTRQWYEERDVFRIGHTLNASTGQGDVEVTVMQLVMSYAALANGGKLLVPYIVDRVESASGETVVQSGPQLRRRVSASTESIEVIREGMWKVVNELGGTAYSYARTDSVEYAAKTGTAQVRTMVRRSDDENMQGWEPDRDHAWFAGYAPATNPEIAFVILLEHGGSGGKDAGPVAKEILEAYFAKPAEEPAATDSDKSSKP